MDGEDGSGIKGVEGPVKCSADLWQISPSSVSVFDQIIKQIVCRSRGINGVNGLSYAAPYPATQLLCGCLGIGHHQDLPGLQIKLHQHPQVQKRNRKGLACACAGLYQVLARQVNMQMIKFNHGEFLTPAFHQRLDDNA